MILAFCFLHLSTVPPSLPSSPDSPGTSGEELPIMKASERPALTGCCVELISKIDMGICSQERWKGFWIYQQVELHKSQEIFHLLPILRITLIHSCWLWTAADGSTLESINSVSQIWTAYLFVTKDNSAINVQSCLEDEAASVFLPFQIYLVPLNNKDCPYGEKKWT